MKTGIELISEERQKGYNNLKENNFVLDFKVINEGILYAYTTNSPLKMELLIKAGALIAAEIDRLMEL